MIFVQQLSWNENEGCLDFTGREFVIFKEGAMNVLFVWRHEMSSAVTSLYRHATAESVLILMAIASHVLISYSVTDARMITKHPPYPYMFIAVSWNFTFCDFDLSQITLECGLNSPKITFLCEWMCEKCHWLSSDIQVMYEHSTFLLFDVHLHAGEGRLSELAMVWGCTLAILYVTYNSYSKQQHKYLFSSLLIPINLSYFEIDELYQWKNML